MRVVEKRTNVRSPNGLWKARSIPRVCRRRHAPCSLESRARDVYASRSVPDIFAIVSKAVFERDARVKGKLVSPGDVWPVDRYNSASKPLQALANGGRIFLVTVRPPKEELWLLGIVDQPKFDGSAWISKTPNTTPVTNISSLRRTIQFESGKGMTQDKGTLGMSLQTPRALAAADVTQIMNLVSQKPA